MIVIQVTTATHELWFLQKGVYHLWWHIAIGYVLEMRDSFQGLVYFEELRECIRSQDPAVVRIEEFHRTQPTKQREHSNWSEFRTIHAIHNLIQLRFRPFE